jgi:AraC-like DNA-binding protein
VCDIGRPADGGHLDFVVNHCRLPSLELTYVQFGVPLRIEMGHNEFFVQGFPVSGAGEVQWNRRTSAVSPSRGGVVGGPQSRASLNYDADWSSLMLKIAPSVVTQRLALLLDRPVNPPLQLTGAVRPDIMARQRRLMLFLANELDLAGSAAPDVLVTEIEDALVVNFLLETEHNYSALLQGNVRAVAPWQVKRAVEYMEQHWDQPITIEVLTRITETSARSLFQLFKKTHDVSPMVYLAQVRLRHAKDMLSRPTLGTSVTRVGFMCGFSNMGHFALKYYAAFGEKPSDTLKNRSK